jgi:methyltransferase (TIGR00027 family)
VPEARELFPRARGQAALPVLPVLPVLRPAGQVVICGAGYDDRALRFRSPRTRFIELDHPATQADKADRLRAVGAGPDGVVLAPADFRDDDVAAVLAAAGHDTVRPTLFLCEAC